MAGKFMNHDLVFHHGPHEYWYGHNKCISVTQLIKSYCKPFDAESNAKRMAARDGVTAESLLDKWRAKGDIASCQGTHVHAEAERMALQLRKERLLTIDTSKHDGPHGKKLMALHRWFADHIEIGCGTLEPEVRVVHPDYLIAGTIDLVAGSYDGVRAIIDYKTNETIEIGMGYNNMLPPFQRGSLKLPDTNWAHYSLQLSMYARILSECYNYSVDKLVLVHLESSGRYVEYSVRNLTNHIDAILERRDAEAFDVRRQIREMDADQQNAAGCEYE